MNARAAIRRPPRCSPVGPRLPRVDSVAASASRLLYDARFVGAWAELQPGIEFMPATGAPDGPLQCLLVESEGGSVEVLVDTSANPTLAIAAGDEDALPGPLQQLAAEALFAPVLARLGWLGLDGARAAAWHPFDRAARSLPEGWCIARTPDGELARFAVTQLPARACEALREGLVSVRNGSGLRRRIALRGAVTLGERSVRLALLRSLALGDVLLLPTMDGLEDDARAWIRFGAPGACRLRAPVHVDDFAVTLEERPEMFDDSVDDDDEFDDSEDDDGTGSGAHAAPAREAGDDDAADPDVIGDLDVSVRFEIDTVPLPLAELEAMQPGYVIELRMPLGSARVRLVAGGSVIGHAELVAVGDRLGARIAKLATRDTPHAHD